MKVTIATLRHSHDRGDDFSVHPDEGTARAALHRDVVSPSWDNVHCPDGASCGAVGCAGVSRTIGVYTIDEAVRIYFAHRDGLESHHIETHDVDLAYPPAPDFIHHPTTSTAVDHRGVGGRLHIAYTGADTAYATSEDHFPLTYRDRAYHAAVHLVRAADGTWTTNPNQKPHLTKKGRYPSEAAPRTFAAVLLDAIAHATAAHWTPEIGDHAQYARAAQALRHLVIRRDELLTELADITAQTGPLWGVVRNYTPPTTPAS